MFDDARSRKVVLVAHCLMNQNSISDGTADLPSQFNEIIEYLMANNIGIIQMFCPELMCLGLDRGDERGSERPLLEENTRIRSLLSDAENIDILSRKAYDLVRQIQQYLFHGFEVLGVIGVDRSPSCGVETTSISGFEAQGEGVFMVAGCHNPAGVSIWKGASSRTEASVKAGDGSSSKATLQ